MKSAHSKILVGEASGVRAPYAVRSPLRAGPKWKFESIMLREIDRQPTALPLTCETSTRPQTSGMKHADFQIGLEFYTSAGRWRCTDVGTRVITAIKVDEHPDANWYTGPP